MPYGFVSETWGFFVFEERVTRPFERTRWPDSWQRLGWGLISRHVGKPRFSVADNPCRRSGYV